MAARRVSRASRRAHEGDIIKGRYKILSLIGKGGMSRVYLAQDLRLTNKQWAIKEVDRRAKDPTGRPIEQSLDGEAELLSGLDHPSIVDIVDIEKTDDFIYVIMDHVEGDDLATVVRREGPQSEENVQKWMLQVCDALSYLHRQNPPIIYRDMKPANIMLHPDGYIKLIDLGVARRYKDDARKDTTAFGTTGYAAPEQYGGAQTDARTDVYGIGATMWHLLAGEAPPADTSVPMPDVREKNPNVGEGFSEVIIPKCCEHERSKRYQNCDELAADLECYQELTREYRGKQTRKVKLFAGCAIASVLCLIIGIASLALRESTITEKFDFQMHIGQEKGYGKEAEDAYLAAIGYRPADTAGYLGLIDAYEADSDFTTKERAQFDDVYQQHLTELEGTDGYSELCYEIGRMYWYFYSYGSNGGSEDNQATRITKSAQFFKIAAQDANFDKQAKASVYSGIAEFTKGISKAIATDDDDDEMYADHWKNLEALAAQMPDEDNETIKLETYSLIANAMETYMDKFKAAGVKKTQAEELYRTVRNGLTKMEPKDADAEQRRADTLSRLQNEVQRKITTVYSDAVVGEN